MNSPNRQLLAIDLADPADAWAVAGFELCELDQRPTVLLGNTAIRLDSAGKGVTGWALDGVTGSLDGLGVTTRPSGLSASVGTVSHQNGISRIDHVVVATDDVVRTTAAFEAAGLVRRGVRSTSIDSTPARQSFFWAGDVIVEMIGPEPIEISDAAGVRSSDDVVASGPDRGPSTATRSEPTASFFGLALVATDLEYTAEAMGEMIGPIRDAVQKGRRITRLRGPATGITVPIVIMSPHVPSGSTAPHDPGTNTSDRPVT